MNITKGIEMLLAAKDEMDAFVKENPEAEAPKEITEKIARVSSRLKRELKGYEINLNKKRQARARLMRELKRVNAAIEFAKDQIELIHSVFRIESTD